MWSRVVLCTLATMLVAGLGPAGALADSRQDATPDSRAAARDRSADLPAGALHASGTDVVIEGAAGVRFDELFRSPEHLRDPAGLPAALRDTVAQRWGVEISPVRDGGAPPTAATATTATSSAAAGFAELDDVAAGRTAWAGPGGDLTGDGREDVLVELYDPQTEQFDLRALRGVDGQQLWEQTRVANAPMAWPAGDLTGDGIDDLLIAARTTGGTERHDDGPECTQDCSYGWTQTFTWRLEVRSGATGTSLWHRTWNGWASYSETWGSDADGGSTTWSYEDENGSLLALPAGDDQAAGAAIALNVVSVRVSGSHEESNLYGLTGRERSTYQLRADTTAELLTARTGVGQLVQRTTDAPVIALLEPAGDLTGDGATELLWNRTHATDEDLTCTWLLVLDSCSGEQSTHTFEVEAVTGALDPLWSVQWDGLYDWWLHTGIGDLDGTGGDDLLVVLGGREDLVVAVAGATGEQLWERPAASSFEYPTPIGSLDGGPGTDLAILRFAWTSGPITGSSANLEIVRIDGASGETLFTTTRPLPASNWVYVWRSEDVNGDGVGDFGGGWITFGEPLEVAESGGFVESGADGEELLSFTSTEDRELRPYADLDGDGATEVIDLTWTDEDGQWMVAATTHRLVPEGPKTLWTIHVPSSHLPRPAGDQDGIAGEELVTSTRVQGAGVWLWEVGSHDGATLVPRWAVIDG
jgi:hypothetical protein